MSRTVTISLSKVTLTIEKTVRFETREEEYIIEDVAFCAMYPTQHGCTVATIFKVDPLTGSVNLTEVVNYVSKMKIETYQD